MKTTPEWFVRADNRLMKIYKAVSYIAMISLIAIMLIAFVNVILEKMAKAGIPVSGINSSADYIAYLHVPIVFFSAGFITVERGHTSVDILTTRFPLAVRRATVFVSSILGAAITGFITYRGFRVLLPDAIAHHITINTSSFSFPQWPFILLYCIGMVMLTFSFLWVILRMIYHYAPPVPEDPLSMPAPEQRTVEEVRDL